MSQEKYLDKKFSIKISQKKNISEKISRFILVSLNIHNTKVLKTENEIGDMLINPS